MSFPLVRALAVIAVASAVTGCNCRSDVDFIPQTEPPVPDNDHGQWLSMGVSPDGRLVASYYDRTRGGLGFAIGEPRDNGDVWWFHEEVDGYPDAEGLDPGDRGWYTSLEVAADGGVWVAYYDQGNGALRTAHRTGRTWTTELADAGGGLDPDTGRWASLALDADDNPVVAHHDAANGTLRVSRRSAAGAWSSEVAHTGEDGVDGDGNPVDANVGQFASLVIHDGVEYIAFYDAANGNLDLIEGFSGAYTHTTIDAEGDVGQWPSIWTDGDELVIAYHDVGNQDLKIARRTGGGAFSFTTIDAGEFVGADTFVFNDTDGLGVVYFDGHDNDMKVARADGSSWAIDVKGGEGLAVGYHNEAAYTAGRWWVASYDYTNRAIFAEPL
jgi:hypothetical protein